MQFCVFVPAAVATNWGCGCLMHDIMLLRPACIVWFLQVWERCRLQPCCDSISVMAANMLG
jgi:hypothetical protein